MAPIDIYRERVEQALSPGARVSAGNEFALGHPNLRRAEAVVWLDLPLPVILWRLVRRTLRRIITGETLWSGNRERLRNAIFSRSLPT